MGPFRKVISRDGWMSTIHGELVVMWTDLMLAQ